MSKQPRPRSRRLALETLEDRAVPAAFTPGNLVVYRIGDGNDPLVNTGNPVFLDEYSPTGTLVQSIPMPTTATGSQRQLIANGVDRYEGLLTLSADGRYLVLTGYATDLGGSTDLKTTTSATVNRTIARVDASGNIDTSTALTDAANQGSPRTVISTNGSDFWLGGETGGLRYTSLGATTSTQLSVDLSDIRQAHIFDGQIYVSTSNGTNTFKGVNTVGTGLQITNGQTTARLPGLSDTTNLSDIGFFFADLNASVPGVDTLYIADENVGGVNKFSLDNNAWSSNGSVGTFADNYRGLTGVVNGTTVTLYATRRASTSSGGGGELVSITDTTGYNADFSLIQPVQIASASTTSRMVLRGVALVPEGTGVIGDLIFNDRSVPTNQLFNNGTDLKVDGVLVNLYDDVDDNGTFTSGIDTLITTKTTANGGLYQFTDLIDGKYFVEADTSNSQLAGTTLLGTPAQPRLVTITPQPVGTSTQYDFNSQNLSASFGIGKLTYFNSTPQTFTPFGTTTSFGISGINGVEANVMNVTPTSGAKEGLRLQHRAVANGTSFTNVNQYTFIADLFIPDASVATPLLQTDKDNNNNVDVALPANTVTSNTWNRIAVTVDVTNSTRKIFVNGNLVDTAAAGSSLALLLDKFNGLDAGVLLFADDNTDVNTFFVNSILFNDRLLSDAEVLALGGPSARGIIAQNDFTRDFAFENEAPVLNGANNLDDIAEDDVNNVGTLVFDLLDDPPQVMDGVGTRFGIAVTATDTANGTWEYSTNGGNTWIDIGLVSDSQALLLNGDTNTKVRFVPNLDFNGTVTGGLSFRAWDRTTGTAGTLVNTSINGTNTAFSTATASSSITVTEVNDDPVAMDDVLPDIAEDSTPTTIPISTLTDLDTPGPMDESGQNLTFALVPSSEVGGTVSISGTDVIFTPDADFFGPASFQYTITDDGFTGTLPDPKSATGTVTFNVTQVNDDPIAVDDILSDFADNQGDRTIPFSDLTVNDAKGPTNEIGQNLTIISVGNAVGGTVSIVNTDVIFSPTPGFEGTASFDYTVEDNGTTNGVLDAKTDIGQVTFILFAINDPPVATNDDLSPIAEDSGARTIQIADLLANDNAGPNESSQTITITNLSNPVGGTVEISGTDVIFTPTPNYNGPASFNYTITDNGTTNGNLDPLNAIALVSFTITEVNDAPFAQDDSLSAINEDSAARAIAIADLLINDSVGPNNESSQTLELTTVSNAVGGTVSINGTNIIFTPAPNFNGTASFRYTVRDNGTTNTVADPRTGTGTVSFVVNSINDPPIARDDTVVTGGARSVVINVLANDTFAPDSGETLILVSVTQGNAGGQVAIVGGQVVYTRSGKFTGIDTFSYTISDGTATATATVTVNVGIPGVQPNRIVLGTDVGVPGLVKVLDATDRTLLFQLNPYGGYIGGVRVATGDVTGDGIDDVITSSATGVGHVKVFDGITGEEIASFLPFGQFPSGLSVASADLDNDGFEDIVVGVQNGPTHVMAFSGQTAEVLQSFFANQGFLGGVRVAAGDINGDGFADIVTVAGPGGNGHIRAYSGLDRSLLQSYLAYVGFQGEVALTVANLSGGGTIVTAAMNLTAGVHVRGTDATGEVFSYFAPQSFSGPQPTGTIRRQVPANVARIASGDTNGDGLDDLFIALGPSTTSTPTKVLLQDGATLGTIDILLAFGDQYRNGAFVG